MVFGNENVGEPPLDALTPPSNSQSPALLNASYSFNDATNCYIKSFFICD
ncbi:hypothetical protein COLO4_12215 [Corchorus olitorius]|uniref:Uncharacterized protein n=1 Tax=Corchorus olitorius TaxID=93759 RepID=A0A1R3K1S1_9ROSI|nr:hypothetical protein COLO4_12215 [Corchorus olitorius]